MKKILSIALVALLAAGTVFAGFSGNASVALGYNWETGAYGFTNGTGFDLALDLASQEIETVAEGDVYAGIKANFGVKLGERYGDEDGTEIWDNKDKGYGIGLFFKLAEAYVAGQDWKVSITGTQGAPDYAKSAIDTYKEKKEDIFGNKHSEDEEKKAVSYSVSSKKAPGVTAEVFGWKASAGFNGNTTKGKEFFNYNAFVQTPEFDFDVVTLQAAIIASRDMDNETDVAKRFDTAIGASAKVGFDADVVSGSVAADYGVKLTKSGDKINAEHGVDVAANLAISPVTLDAYYALKANDDDETDNLLSAKVAVDLTSFNVPVALTVTGKDLINKQDLSAKADFTIDAFKIGVSGGYVINSKKVSAGASFEYAHDLFTAKAGADWSMVVGTENSHILSASASIESAAVIPGATLSLAYGAAKNDMNFIAGQTKDQNFGKIEAKCKIAF